MKDVYKGFQYDFFKIKYIKEHYNILFLLFVYPNKYL